MKPETIRVKLNEKKIYKLISSMQPIAKNLKKPKWWSDGRSKEEKKIAKQYAGKDIFYEWNSNKLRELVSLVPDKVYKHFKIDKNSAFVCVNRLPPAMFSSPHVDRHNNFKNNMNMAKKVKRVWISLSAPALGHAFFLDKKNVLYNIPKGTAFLWNGKNLHSGVNAGVVDRYYITVDGVKNG
tara:strand:- start:115 stop:660 length:546 start_codon:yes stop_codon:yes gene_type:complete